VRWGYAPTAKKKGGVMDMLFYMFSSLSVVSGVMVIQSRNPVHSVLFLILVFFNAAGLLLLLGLDFFAMIFLVVYVGAIAVLFLFVVMMLNIKIAEMSEKRLRYVPVGGVLGLLFLFETLMIVDNDLIPLLSYSNVEALGDYQATHFTDWADHLHTATNIQAVGNVMYTYYVYFFLMASLILLVAMIGAIVLTMQKSIHIKRQQVFLQNTRDFAKTIRKIA
jgi:NADH:ubiquinone oxidoreductase subunit 6 (subunit J)